MARATTAIVGVGGGGGGVDTVSVVEPDTDVPPAVAVMVDVPPKSPVASPFVETEATALLLEVHVNVVFGTTTLFASLAVAVNCCELPKLIVGELGVTVTVVIAPATVMDADPDRPLALAVMLVDPAATPVATPVLETVAMLELPGAQLNDTPLTGLSHGSYAVAVNCCVPPERTVAWLGVTPIEEGMPVQPCTVIVAYASTDRSGSPPMER